MKKAILFCSFIVIFGIVLGSIQHSSMNLQQDRAGSTLKYNSQMADYTGPGPMFTTGQIADYGGPSPMDNTQVI